MAESKVRRENYITIQGFMLTDLKLKGNELIVYACIYGFSQAENQVFSGSLQYLADWTNSTKQGVMKCLKLLVEKGYIVKKDNIINGVKFCEYYATELNTVLNKVAYPMQQSLTGGIKQSLTNNISFNNTEDNIDNNIVPQAKLKKEKNRYGEYQNVLLTDDEMKKLQTEFATDWQNRIETLSGYIESTGKTYKNHLATIKNWARMDKERNKDKVYGATGIKIKPQEQDDLAGIL